MCCVVGTNSCCVHLLAKKTILLMTSGRYRCVLLFYCFVICVSFRCRTIKSITLLLLGCRNSVSTIIGSSCIYNKRKRKKCNITYSNESYLNYNKNYFYFFSFQFSINEAWMLICIVQIDFVALAFCRIMQNVVNVWDFPVLFCSL